MFTGTQPRQHASKSKGPQVFRCLWQRHLEQEPLQDVSGGGTSRKKCFKMWQGHLDPEMLPSMSVAEALGARNVQDVSGRGKMSLAQALRQEMLQDVSGRGTWSQNCFKMSQSLMRRRRGASNHGSGIGSLKLQRGERNPCQSPKAERPKDP